MTVLNSDDPTVQQKAEKSSTPDGVAEASGKNISWVDRVTQASQADTRFQPWKKALGETHDKGADGEDLINLNLPNFVQCGTLAA